ncbi:MAG: GntR family transcriptional regulator [Cryomorphaceae bacterium]|nr:GntR family transcriptional regulator [Cryomorphaceae bacterium]
MIYLGKYNTLHADKFTKQGVYLTDGDGDEVLLPNAYLPKNIRPGDEIEVFVYLDSEERPIATTLRPTLTVGEIGVLELTSVVPYGAFFNIGLAKEILVPNALQYTPIREEDEAHVVYLMIDEASDRLVGTTYISKYLSNKDLDLQVGDEVDLMVYGKTELGWKVVVNKKHDGLIYHDEVFKPISNADELKGYVKKIRTGNKLDIALEKFGYRKVEPGVETILDTLKGNDGFIPLNDKSDPEDIKRMLHMSKKVFKKAVGALYKQRKITLEEKGIRLNDKRYQG